MPKMPTSATGPRPLSPQEKAARIGRLRAAIRDLSGISGLGMIGTGLWFIHWQTALIAVGGILLALAVIGAWRSARANRA